MRAKVVPCHKTCLGRGLESVTPGLKPRGGWAGLVRGLKPPPPSVWCGMSEVVAWCKAILDYGPLSVPSGAEARVDILRLLARLKSCPFKAAADARQGPGPAMKLAGPLAAGWRGLRLALGFEIEEIEPHCGADEILQGGLIDLVAFVDVDGAPDISVEAGVE